MRNWSNPCYTSNADGVLARHGHIGLDYNDGDETELAIAAIVRAARDRSTSSEELWSAISDWPTEYHLSSQRANILRPLAITPGMKILELGAGMGAITRYLGETGAQVVAVEGASRRAAIARSRTADLANVTVVCDGIMEFAGDVGQFDLVLLIGVLEYAPRFIAGSSPAQDLLRKARQLVKENGRVVIAIENALGLKYLAGAAEDHTGIRYQSVEDRYEENGVRTYGYSTLSALAKTAGLTQQRALIAHPDYKLATQVVDTTSLAASHIPASRLLRLARTCDGQAPVQRQFSEMLASRNFDRNGLLLDVANSIVLITSPTDEPTTGLIPSGESAWLYSSGRRLAYQTVTRIRTTPDDRVEVVKERLFDIPNDEIDVTWKNSPPSQFRDGPLLSERLIDAYLTAQTGNWKLLREMFLSYATFLMSAKREDGSLPKELFDAIPRNIICAADGWHLIDLEWEARIPIQFGFIVYRSARSILDELSQIPASSTLAVLFPTRLAVLADLLEIAGVPSDDTSIREFAELDARITMMIAGRPGQDAALFLGAAALDDRPGASRPEEVIIARLARAENRFKTLEQERDDLLVIREKLKHDLQTSVEDCAFRSEALALTGQALKSTQSTVEHERAILAARVNELAQISERHATERIFQEAALKHAEFAIASHQQALSEKKIELATCAAALASSTKAAAADRSAHDIALKRIEAALSEKKAELATCEAALMNSTKAAAADRSAHDIALKRIEAALSEKKAELATCETALKSGTKAAAADRAAHEALMRDILVVSGNPDAAPGVDPVRMIAGLAADAARFHNQAKALGSELETLRLIARDRTTDLYGQLHKTFRALPDPTPDQPGYALRARLAELSGMHLDGEGFDVPGHLGYVLHAAYTAADATATMRDHITNLESRLHERDRIIAEREAALSALPVRIARRLARELRQLAPIESRRGALIDWIATRIDGRPRLRVTSVSSTPISVTSAAPEPTVEPIPPESWQPSTATNDSSLADLITRTIEAPAPADGPLISVILPVYRIPPRVLARTIGCLVSQNYKHWEACIAFADPDGSANRTLLESWSAREPRLKIKLLDRNQGISGNSNAALEMANGEWVALLDHDDELPPDALARLVNATLERPQIDLWYTDKDCLDDASGLRLRPLVKPEWSPEMMFSVNYLTHLNLLRTEVLRKIGGWRSETDGAQDWDLFLRMSSAGRGVARATGIAYHWRIIAGSTSTGVGAKPYVVPAQLRTIEDHVQRSGFRAEVRMDSECGFRIRWEIPAKAQVLIATVVTDTSPGGISEQLAGALRTGCTRLRARHVLCLAQPLSAPVWMEPVIHPTGALAALAKAVRSGNEEWVVLVIPGVVGATPDWIDELVGWLCQDPAIAFSTPLILDTAGLVVESGRVVDASGRGHPLFRGASLRSWGVFGGPLWHRNVRAGSPWGIAFRRAALARALEQLDLSDCDPNWSTALCLHALGDGGRGVVVTPTKLTIEVKSIPSPPPFDPTLADDPYFHPDLHAAGQPRLDS